jgi:hypothetical protein
VAEAMEQAGKTVHKLNLFLFLPPYLVLRVGERKKGANRRRRRKGSSFSLPVRKGGKEREREGRREGEKLRDRRNGGGNYLCFSRRSEISS